MHCWCTHPAAHLMKAGFAGNLPCCISIAAVQERLPADCRRPSGLGHLSQVTEGSCVQQGCLQASSTSMLRLLLLKSPCADSKAVLEGHLQCSRGACRPAAPRC